MDLSHIVKFAKEILLLPDFQDKFIDIKLKKINYIQIDFSIISKNNFVLAEELLENSHEVIIGFEEAISSIIDKSHKVRPEFINIPDSEKFNIWKLRSKDIGKFGTCEGIITVSNPPIPEIYMAQYQCSACAYMMNKIKDENEDYIIKPTRCPKCKGTSMILINSFRKDVQYIRIQEDKKSIEENEPLPRDIIVRIEDNLTRPEIDGKLTLGTKILVAGTMKSKLFKKGKLVTEKHYLLGNSIIIKKIGFEDIKLSDDDINQIKSFDTSTIFEYMRQSIFSQHMGEDDVKDALLLSLVGSRPITINNVLKERDTINVLLIGPPGCGKSQLIRNIIQYNPINMFSTATFASAVGLGVSITKDQDLGIDVACPGLLVMCNKGILGIDELDKMEDEQMSKLTTAISDQTLPVFKGGIRHPGFKTQTTVVVGMNPINKIFTNHQTIEEQLGIPHDFKDRFDCIFVLLLTKDEKERDDINYSILQVFNNEYIKEQKNDFDFIQKYIAYCRRINPNLEQEQIKYINELLKKMTRMNNNYNNDDNNYISYRITANLARLSIAVARIRQHYKITEDDINKAFNIILAGYKSRGLVTDSGIIDVERLELDGMTKIDINKKVDFMTLFSQIENNKLVDEVELINILTVSNYTEAEAELLIEKMKREGMIYSPRRGFLSKAG